MLRQGKSRASSNRTSSHRSEGSAHRSEESADSGLSQATERARQYASDIAEQTRQAASSYASTASEYAEQTRRAVGEQSEHLMRQAQSTAQSTLDRILRDQPLIIAAAGLAAGAAVAATFPATEIEKQNLGPVGERVTEAAHRVGDQLKEATMQAGEKLKDAAVERGLTAEGMKEVASEVAGAFTSSMSNRPEFFVPAIQLPRVRVPRVRVPGVRFPGVRFPRLPGVQVSGARIRRLRQAEFRSLVARQRPEGQPMTDTSLRGYELDVERARSKLAADLATLRSPATFSAVTDQFKHHAIDAKDAMVEHARSSVQSTVNGWVEDLKAKAAANPAAVLAIGAGIAWRLVRNPPIATALVGAGLFSLLRTQASTVFRGADHDYFQEGKERLKEQASDLASAAKDAAVDAGEVVAARTADAVDAVKATAQAKVQEWSAGAGEAIESAGSSLRSEFQSVAEEARRKARDLTDHVRQATASASTQAGRVAESSDRMVRDAMSAGEQMLAAPGSGDKVLLGVAGIAVAAALGMAYQKRMAAADS